MLREVYGQEVYLDIPQLPTSSRVHRRFPFVLCVTWFAYPDGAAVRRWSLPSQTYRPQQRLVQRQPARWSGGYAAANGPVQDTPEVAAAKAQHLAAVEQVKLRNAAAGI